MKIIIREFQEHTFEIVNPEIVIKDKDDPSRTYLFIPSGGYIMFTADYDYKLFRIDADMTSEIISFETKDEDRNVED